MIERRRRGREGPRGAHAPATSFRRSRSWSVGLIEKGATPLRPAKAPIGTSSAIERARLCEVQRSAASTVARSLGFVWRGARAAARHIPCSTSADSEDPEMNSRSGQAGGLILAGIAVFVVSSIVQSTMGDSSMFSMTYVEHGFVQGLLVNVTFWPGWIVTVGLIGSGVAHLLESDDPGEDSQGSWE